MINLPEKNLTRMNVERMHCIAKHDLEEAVLNGDEHLAILHQTQLDLAELGLQIIKSEAAILRFCANIKKGENGTSLTLATALTMNGNAWDDEFKKLIENVKVD